MVVPVENIFIQPKIKSKAMYNRYTVNIWCGSVLYQKGFEMVTSTGKWIGKIWYIHPKERY